jgi:hypothetical protein
MILVQYTEHQMTDNCLYTLDPLIAYILYMMLKVL